MIYCGFYEGKKVSYGAPRQDRHCMTLGPTGSGKDTSVLIPNLLMSDEPALVFDPAGEALATTGRHRQKMGHEVITIDPMGLMVNLARHKRFAHLAHFKSQGFNPIHGLRVNNPNFSSQCGEIIESIFTIDPKDPHWGRRSRQLGKCLLMRECWLAEELKNYTPSLEHVMDMLSLPHTNPDEKGVSLQKLMIEISKHDYRPMARLSASFIPENKEVESVLGCATEQCEALMSDDNLLTDMARGGPFDWGRLKDEKITVYVIMPAKQFETHSVWLRLLLGSALNSMMDTGPGKYRPIFYLNEVGNLKRLEVLKRSTTNLRKYGARLWLFFQDLNQIDEVYGFGAAKSFVGNAGFINAFATNDPATMDYFSYRAGTETREVRSVNAKPDGSPAGGGNRSVAGFKVLNPEDISAIPDRETVNFIHPVPHALELKTPFYEDFCRGYDPNPYH